MLRLPSSFLGLSSLASSASAAQSSHSSAPLLLPSAVTVAWLSPQTLQAPLSRSVDTDERLVRLQPLSRRDVPSGALLWTMPPS